MTTTTIFSKSNDTSIASESTTAEGYGVAREGTGTLLVTNPAQATFNGLGQRNVTGGSPNFRVREYFLAFATALIPDADSITSVTFSMHTTLTILQDGPDFDMEVRQDTWQPTVDTGDYVAGSALGARTLFASLNTAAVSPNARFDWTENGSNLRDAINKTGDTEFLLCSSRTRLNQPPPNDTSNEVDFFTANDVGTTRDPRLIIIHAAPPGPPAGPTPVVQADNTSVQNAISGSHTVSLPAGIVSGDLLIVIFGIPLDRVITFPAGWTQTINHLSLSLIRQAIFFRVADGTEGASITVTVSTSPSAIRSSHNSYRITGHEDPATQAPQANGADSNGTLSDPDPPNLIPDGGAKNYLWLASETVNDNTGINNDPPSYTNRLLARVTGVSTASVRRALNASSENPGIFDLPSSEQWVAITLAIHPAPGATAALSGTITDDNELDIRNG